MRAVTLNDAWVATHRKVVAEGTACSPRGRPILELDHHAVAVDMRYPVLTIPARNLSPRFAASEAHWMLSGSDRLADLGEAAEHMAPFSDDGVTLTGAYGPRIVAQLPYVIDTLLSDPDTRRATLTTWTPSPGSSKDVPCTVAMDFKVRRGQLDMHVFMRSSDVWLGLPYDVFSFTCVAMMVLARLGERAPPDGTLATLGTLYLTAASSHLYIDVGHHAVDVGDASDVTHPLPVPETLYLYGPGRLMRELSLMRHSRRGDPTRWWEPLW